MSERTFALTADVAEAHRQVPVDPLDWHYLGAQISPSDVVFLNTAGTFGISSASYYWSRVGSALGRLSQYISGHTAHTWHLLVADDFHLEAGGVGYREALMTFFPLCHAAGVPLSWPKTAGGDSVAWVGFEILHRTYCLGVSERRAEWFVKWSETVAAAGCIDMDSFEEGLGRIACVAGALEFERPFLASLCRFLTPSTRLYEQSSSLCFFLSCAISILPPENAPRVDALGLAWGLAFKDKNGNIDTRLSPWFSAELRRED